MHTNRQTLSFYWEQIKRFKLSFFTALIAIPLASLFIDTLLPYFFSQAIGALTKQNHAAVTHDMVIAAYIGVAGFVANLIGFQMLVRHEADVRVSLSDSLFKRIINKDMRFFVNEKVGALTSRYIDFIRSHIVLQDLLIIRTLGFAISVGIGLAIVATQSLMLSGVILFLILLILLEVRWSLQKRKPYRHARKTMTSEIHGKVADAFTNNLIVKTFAGEALEEQHLSTINKKFRHIYVKDLSFLSAEGSTRVLVMTATQIIALSLCAMLVFNGQMTLAIAIFTLTYLQRIASQLFTLGEMLNGYDQALLEAAPMTELLEKEIVITNKPDARVLENFKPSIELQDVHYHYEDSANDILKGINFHINAGEKIGLVGHSGAGKTTITHLLLRFSDVTEGAILVGDNDVRDITQESLRQNIAYVPQEPMLFHRSLRENIAYGKPDATDDEIREAARQANALEFIDTLPDQLGTLVGERGVKLSGGQRQRIAIARALLKNAPILLLDEATSALDSESEKLIQDALEKLMKGRTSIVIAHRLSTIAKLDRIIVLKNGLIGEQGTHSELLKTGGTYAKLWSHQSGGFIEE